MLLLSPPPPDLGTIRHSEFEKQNACCGKVATALVTASNGTSVVKIRRKSNGEEEAKIAKPCIGYWDVITRVSSEESLKRC